MRIKIRTLFIVVFLHSIIASNAQKVHYSIHLGLNYPYLKSSTKNPETFPATIGYITLPGYKESFNNKLGFNLGGQLSYNITNKLKIETGLHFNLIRYKRNIELTGLNINPHDEIYVPDSLLDDIIISDSLVIGTPINITSFKQDENIGKSSILYTQIPVHISYAFLNQKLLFKLGITASFLTYSEVYKYNVDENYYYELPSAEKDKTSDGLTNFLLNGDVQVEYLFYKQFGINFNYSYSFNSLYDEDESTGNPKYNIFSLGLSYYL